jgi:hypothetical protein
LNWNLCRIDKYIPSLPLFFFFSYINSGMNKVQSLTALFANVIDEVNAGASESSSSSASRLPSQLQRSLAASQPSRVPAQTSTSASTTTVAIQETIPAYRITTPSPIVPPSPPAQLLSVDAAPSQPVAPVLASAPGVDVPVVRTEIRHLMRRGLVSSLSPEFRSALERIVGASPSNPLAPVVPRPASAAPQPNYVSTRHGVPPPPPPMPSTVPVVHAPLQQQRLEESTLLMPPPAPVRAPDRAYREQLIIPEHFNSSVPDELQTLVDMQATSRILSSQFRNSLEAVMQEHMTRRNLLPVRVDITPRARSAHTHATFPTPTIHNLPAPPLPPALGPVPAPQQFTSRVAGYGNNTDSALWRINQDMAQMQSRLDEIQRSFQASLQMQMQMQRMMTQEMSAVFNAIVTSPPVNFLDPCKHSSQPPTGQVCRLC